ncbi:MAG: creatininase family protein [Gemmataceae bacterium]
MKYGELKHTDIEKMDKTNKVVLLPLASLEQHGLHCPLLTDSMLGGEVAARVEAALPDTVLLLPVQWLGSSDHHLKFPGSISVPSSLYIDMVCHICECILNAGFRRIFLQISHGGNEIPCQEVIYRLGMKHRDRDDFWIASAGYWSIADDVLRIPEMTTERITHACEYETSMVLALKAELVDMSQAKGEHIWMESRYYFPDLTTTRRSKVNVSLPFERMTRTGAIGKPELATAEKGHKLFEVISAKVADFVREFAHWPRPRMK